MGDTALQISFGPIVDRMFIAALSLIIFVYGTTAVLWIYGEIEKLVKRIWNIEPEVPEFEHELISEPISPVLYEVMWTHSNDREYSPSAFSRRRIVHDPRDGARDLIRENGAGYIRYRVWLDVPPPWGFASYHEPPEINLAFVKNFQGEDLTTFANKKDEDGEDNESSEAGK